MKVRDSGMPEQDYWEALLHVPVILDRMRVGERPGDLAEFGCGYGTFTIPAARRVSGIVHALDLEEGMIDATRERGASAGVANINLIQRDFVAQGTGLADGAVSYVMLFNILHHERPREMLDEAYRILAPGGLAGIIHWRFDPATPRGPAMEIRPRPEVLRESARAAGLRPLFEEPIDLPPWHFGILAEKRMEEPR
jgi:ubiquinone/menaquinone biosynthesis C-methylase UbiE